MANITNVTTKPRDENIITSVVATPEKTAHDALERLCGYRSLSSAAMTRAELWLLLLIENEQGDRTGHFHDAAAYGAHII